jgi:hypothetical protein
MTQWLDDMKALLGKHVMVTLAEDDEKAIAWGKLLSFDDGGEVVIQDEMGFLHYCWPNLKCVGVSEEEIRERVLKSRNADSSGTPDSK